MAVLVLLNGPPAAGKSTLAARLVERRPLALRLDIDEIRRSLGRWADDPEAAGHRARAVAVAMCRARLDAGFDVVIPQFLARAPFVEELEAVAREYDADFVEFVVWLERAEAIAAFTRRTAESNEPTHVDAAHLVAQSTDDDPVGSMHDRLTHFLTGRPHARRVDVVPGDVDATTERLVAALADCGVDW